jgi:hypothetical protein
MDVIKDFILCTGMIAVMVWCVFHDVKAKFWFFLPAKKKPVVRKKFQGSAATFVQ